MSQGYIESCCSLVERKTDELHRTKGIPVLHANHRSIVTNEMYASVYADTGGPISDSDYYTYQRRAGMGKV